MTDIEEDPTYATIQASYRRWGISESGFDELDEIETHYCEPEELGLTINQEYDGSNTEYIIDIDNRN